jgi:hypothetical protein
MRFRRRIGARDRLFLGLFVLVTVVATVTAVLVRDQLAQPAPGSRCVTVIRASFMGGATFKYCGASAARLCRTVAPADKDLATQCGSLGLALRP